MTTRISLHDEVAIIEWLKSIGQKPFRYTQIEHAWYKDLATTIDGITTLSLDLRTQLAEVCETSSITLASRSDSADKQTSKLLFKTHDDKLIEAVIMRHLSGRTTLCISCQVGCPMACAFCATGRLGLARNLTAWEMLDQVLWAERQLRSEGEDKTIRNVVFMGMGEPLLNYDNVKTAMTVLHAPKKFGLGNRRITISTCGIVPGIAKLAQEFPQVSLAVSLHAPTDEARKGIMPVEHTYPLDMLMTALDSYVETTRNRVFYEYIMIAGVTDRLEYADALAKLLSGRLAHVNFIPYNPGEGSDSDGFLPSSRIIIDRFQKTLERAGVPSTVRHTMGDDIDAACGQLALKYGEERLVDSYRKKPTQNQ